MSHFSTIKTTISNREYLIAALKKANYQFKVGSYQCNGYNKQKTDVEILITLQNTNYNFGFKKNNGYFELVADWYGIKNISIDNLLVELEDEIKIIEYKIKQEYAYNITINKLEEQGFDVDEELRENGEIHIKLSRLV
jgi:hypothetical protein